MPSGPLPAITTANFNYPRATSYFQYQLIGTNGVTSWSATGLPSGVVLNAQTGMLSGASYATAGNKNIVITATNANGSTQKALVMNLYMPQIPNITSNPYATYMQWVPFNYQITVDEVCNVEVNGSLPSGFTYNPNTRVISGSSGVTSFSIELLAINAAGQTSFTLVNDTSAPAAPQNLHASNIEQNKVRLDWDAPFDNVGINNYAIYRNGVNVGAASANVSYTEVSGLSPGTTYTFKIKARDASQNESGFSNEITVTTLS